MSEFEKLFNKIIQESEADLEKLKTESAAFNQKAHESADEIYNRIMSEEFNSEKAEKADEVPVSDAEKTQVQQSGETNDS